MEIIVTAWHDGYCTKCLPKHLKSAGQAVHLACKRSAEAVFIASCHHRCAGAQTRSEAAVGLTFKQAVRKVKLETENSLSRLVLYNIYALPLNLNTELCGSEAYLDEMMDEAFEFDAPRFYDLLSTEEASPSQSDAWFERQSEENYSKRY